MSHANFDDFLAISADLRDKSYHNKDKRGITNIMKLKEKESMGVIGCSTLFNNSQRNANKKSQHQHQYPNYNPRTLIIETFKKPTYPKSNKPHHYLNLMRKNVKNPYPLTSTNTIKTNLSQISNILSILQGKWIYLFNQLYDSDSIGKEEFQYEEKRDCWQIMSKLKNFYCTFPIK